MSVEHTAATRSNVYSGAIRESRDRPGMQRKISISVAPNSLLKETSTLPALEYESALRGVSVTSRARSKSGWISRGEGLPSNAISICFNGSLGSVGLGATPLPPGPQATRTSSTRGMATIVNFVAQAMAKRTDAVRAGGADSLRSEQETPPGSGRNTQPQMCARSGRTQVQDKIHARDSTAIVEGEVRGARKPPSEDVFLSR